MLPATTQNKRALLSIVPVALAIAGLAVAAGAAKNLVENLHERNERARHAQQFSGPLAAIRAEARYAAATPRRTDGVAAVQPATALDPWGFAEWSAGEDSLTMRFFYYEFSQESIDTLVLVDEQLDDGNLFTGDFVLSCRGFVWTSPAPPAPAAPRFAQM